jgi:HEAT repeat protein
MLIAVFGALLAAPARGADEPESCAELIEQLNDPHPFVRVDAAWKLSHLGPQGRDAVPRLIELLADETEKNLVWTSAQTALESIGAEAVEALGKALSDSSIKVRCRAAEVLQKIGADASPALPRLVDAAWDSDANMRRMVADALGAVDKDGFTAVPVLCLLLGNDERHVSEAAARALEKYPHLAQIAVPRILPLLIHTRAHVRKQAAKVLGCFPDAAERIVPELVLSLGDLDPGVRGWAACSLGDLGQLPQIAVPALLRRQQDQGRYSEIWWCGLSGWQSTERSVSRDVITALANFPGQSATVLPVALANVEHSPGFAAPLLQRISAESSRKLGGGLLRMLEKPDLSDYGRVSILEMLGEFRVKEAVPAITKLLDHPPPPVDPKLGYATAPDVRLSAAVALVRIDRTGNPVAWQRVLKDLEVRQSYDAITAVAAAGDKAEEALPLLIPILRGGGGLPDNLLTCLGGYGPAAAEAVPDVLDAWDFEWDAKISLLHKIGPAAIAPLVKMIDEKTGAPADCAAALASFGKDAWPAVLSLVPLCEADDPKIALAAIKALGEIGAWPERSVPALREAVTHDRVAVRAAAALALASFSEGAADSVPPITTALDDEYIIVRRAAAQALGKFGKSAASARDTLERVAKDDPSPLVRHAAREAFVAIDNAAKQ